MARPLRYNPPLAESSALAPRPRPIVGRIPKERWKDIVGWEGFYRISDRGRVMSVERQVWWDKRSGITKIEPKKILAPTPYPPPAGSRRRGHYACSLFFDAKPTRVVVHRLVAIHFVHNPYGDDQAGIDFADDDWRNIYWSNLVWREPGSGGGPRRSRFRDPSGKVHVSESIAAACRLHGLNPGAMSQVLNGHASHHKGWTRADD